MLKTVPPETSGEEVRWRPPGGSVDIPYRSNYRIVRWIGEGHDAHPSFGPAIFTAAALYFVIQIIVAWVFIPSYSLVSNSISDLGETSCGGYGSPGMCSPRWWLMDYAGFLLLGLIMVIGSALLYHEFTERVLRERRAAMVGFGLMALAGLGSILVGFFPENENRTMHIIGAFLADRDRQRRDPRAWGPTHPAGVHAAFHADRSAAWRWPHCCASRRTSPLASVVGSWSGSLRTR